MDDTKWIPTDEEKHNSEVWHKDFVRIFWETLQGKTISDEELDQIYTDPSKNLLNTKTPKKVEYQLKACPFCGGEAHIVETEESDGYCHHTVGFVACKSCHCQTGGYCIDGWYGSTDTIQNAVDAWNRRAE